MNDQLTSVAEAYLQHLRDDDLEVLLERVGEVSDVSSRAGLLRSNPSLLHTALERPETFEAVFGGGRRTDPFDVVSPFLVFAVAISRTAVELSTASYVMEWLSPHSRAPVFDVSELRDFLVDPWRRLFLVELLASYTHVSSGSMLVSTRRGWRRRRFSELDPVQMAGLLDVASSAERPGIYRRLGDLTLFLTGVFPDGVARRGFGPVEEGRLWRAGGLPPTDRGERRNARSTPGIEDNGPVALLEELGRRSYAAASHLIPPPLPLGLHVLGELPQRFSQARRILDVVTRRFLFVERDRWFGLGGD